MTISDLLSSALVIGLSVLLEGCGDKSSDALSLKPSVISGPVSKAEPDQAAYRFRFLLPEKHEFLPGEPFKCRFTLEVLEGARPPTFVLVQLLQDKTFVDSHFVEPKGKPGARTYLFERTQKAPKELGRYGLRVEAIQMTIYRPKGGKAETRDVKTHSPTIDLIVKQKDG